MNISTWKILTIDNVASFNKIIELLATNLSFQKKNLSVLKASSLKEGREILSQNSDIALILVDIMIEDKDSGLEFIKFIRNDLKNQDTRIILRTGYPDSLPEKNVIQNYEIDGYISKEINSQTQIEVSIITAIRNYYQIISNKESLRSLAGSIVHEIRNPLNAINLAQNQIKDLLLNPSHNPEDLRLKITDLASTISDSVSQADRIIKIILNDLQEKPIKVEDFAILNSNQILMEIIEKFSQKQKIKLDLKNNFNFKAIPDRLKLVIYNLLNNSFCYLGKYPNLIATIGTEIREINKRNWNVIFVYDNGPGIPAYVIPKLFDNFFTFKKNEGTGLGLVFCKRNMQIFGGDIICESGLSTNIANDKQENSWTKFSLLFPIISNEDFSLYEANPNDFLNKNAISDTSDNFLHLEKIKNYLKIIKDKKIIIADDQKLNRLVIGKTLKYYNLMVSEVENGKELLDFYVKSLDKNGKSSFDIILTDLMMPPYNAEDAIKEIRKIENHNNISEFERIPIIVLSGGEEQKTTSELSKFQVNDYFVKGSDPQILLKTIANHLLKKSG